MNIVKKFLILLFIFEFLDIACAESCLTDKGKRCLFPVKYKGSIYTSCGKNGYTKNWCPTSLKSSGEYKDWDLCYPGDCAGCVGQADGCCTPDTPCGVNEGDCDDDDDCERDLLCGKDNCPSEGFMWNSADDCCYKSEWAQLSTAYCWTDCDKKPGECEACSLGSGDSKLVGYCCRKGW